MSETLAAALTNLEDAMERAEFFVHMLAPGISEEEVRETLAAVGVEPNADVLTWFGWHNGRSGPGHGLSMSWGLISLGQAVTDREFLVTEFSEVPDTVVPIMDTDTGAMCIDVASGGLVESSWGGDEPRFPGISVVEMVDFFAKMMDAGILHSEKGRFWDPYERKDFQHLRGVESWMD